MEPVATSNFQDDPDGFFKWSATLACHDLINSLHWMPSFFKEVEE
jgi:hypothetical protein